MEPITLCGAAIVAFGLWVECEPKMKVVIKWISRSTFFSELISQPTLQRPVYVRRMPICLAKTSHM